MKRLFLTLLLAAVAYAAPSPRPTVTMDQFITWIMPSPNQGSEPIFVGPSWIWALVSPLPLSLEMKAQIAYQIWVSLVLAGSR